LFRQVGYHWLTCDAADRRLLPERGVDAAAPSASRPSQLYACRMNNTDDSVKGSMFTEHWQHLTNRVSSDLVTALRWKDGTCATDGVTEYVVNELAQRTSSTAVSMHHDAPVGRPRFLHAASALLMSPAALQTNATATNTPEVFIWDGTEHCCRAGRVRRKNST